MIAAVGTRGPVLHDDGAGPERRRVQRHEGVRRRAGRGHVRLVPIPAPRHAGPITELPATRAGEWKAGDRRRHRC